MESLFSRMDYFAEIDSTNDYLRSLAGGGQARAVVASRQSAGRGRHGRSWHSPAGQGLYASYLFYPPWTQERAPLLNVVATLAVKRSLSRLDPAIPGLIRIKEPNDILFEDRKVGGVLAELGTLGERVTWAIVGIGVNLSQSRFAIDDAPLAPTSLRLEGFPAPHPLDLYGLLTREFESLYRQACSGGAVELQDEFHIEIERTRHLPRRERT